MSPFLFITDRSKRWQSTLHVLGSGLVILIAGCQWGAHAPRLQEEASFIVAPEPQPPATVGPAGDSRPALPPTELLRRTVSRELAALNAAGHYRYRFCERTPHGTETRDMIETSQWLIGHLILKNGRPLSPAESRLEDGRLQALLADHTRLQELQKEQSYHEARVRRMIEALPEAFIYEYSNDGKNVLQDNLVCLRYRPNPTFKPKSWELRVFQGIEGTALIDPDHDRVVRIEATLFRDVDFGWGILGRVCRGGSFLLEQHGSGSNRWAITTLALHYTNQRWLVANTRVDSVTQASEFSHLPGNLILAKGVEQLLSSNSVTVVAEETKATR